MSAVLLSSIQTVHEGTQHRVKDREKAALFHAICTGRSVTRQLLSREAGFRPSSVSEAVQELVDDGLVTERSLKARKQSGRPRLVLAQKPDRLQAISVYVDSRELKAVLLNMDEALVAEESRSIPGKAGNREFLSVIRDLLERLAGRVQRGTTLVGASLALIGTVNPRTLAWVGAARWPRLANLDLSALQEHVGFPVILRRTNDVELEYQLQSASRVLGPCALLLHWGFGIGSAVSFRGEALSSSQGRFGEIGHVRLDPGSSAHCLCGSRGCLEATAALWALLPSLTRRLTAVPVDEPGLAPLLADSRVQAVPEIRRALVSVRDALLVLYQIFHPDTIFLSGPFTENPVIFHRIADGFRRALPPYALGAVSVFAVPAGNPGSPERCQSAVPSGAPPDPQEALMSGLTTLVVGGGMITADVILPSLYHLQRRGLISGITVCALSSGPLRALAGNEAIREAFPESSFAAAPPLGEPEENAYPDLYADQIERMAPRQLVVVAVPDQMHYPVVMRALRADQHVLCVKPLVLEHRQALEIEREAHERGLFVGVEYHKRFDRRSLVARRDYRKGLFGEFVFGEARLVEPYYYRHSNFQSWFTTDMTDPFTYIGCHYIDLVFFITGLQPAEVSVAGIRRRFANGKEGFLWSLARVRWQNGALLSVANGLGYPDLAAGSNDQGLLMYCEGKGGSGMIRHDDHDRGVSYTYLQGVGPGGSHFNFMSPDFFRLVPWEGEGARPVGYGYDSIEAIVESVARIERAGEGLGIPQGLEARRRAIREADAHGIIATPANSSINELVIEAARKSILAEGVPVGINGEGAVPRAERA